MPFRRVVPVLVLVLAVILAVAGIINYASGDGPDYADLSPAPDVIIWEEGDETTLWLETNRRHVDLRIDSVSLGLGNIRRVFPAAGETLTLGRAEGCQDWVVSKLTVAADSIDPSTNYFQVHGEIDRNGYDGAVTMHVKYRTTDGSDPTAVIADVESPVGTDIVDLSVAEFEIDLVGTDNDFDAAFEWDNPGEYIIEASKSQKFPEAITRSIRVDTAAETHTTDSEAEGIRMAADTGIGIIACDEHDDVVVTLHGEEGEELNRYLLDVVSDPPTPTPGPTPPAQGYVTRRVCVDAADHQVNYLDGGETVGAALPTPESSYGEWQISGPYVYFFDHTVTARAVQLSVSAAGASGLGLDADKVYALVLTADAPTPQPTPTPMGAATPAPAPTPQPDATLNVGVWVDTSTLSPGDDGLCS